jgi:hypothetical protein
MLRSASQTSLVAASSFGEVTASTHRLSYFAAQALDRVGGANDQPHRGREGKERNYLFPVAPPALRDRRYFSDTGPGEVFEVNGKRQAMLPACFVTALAMRRTITCA